MSIYRLFLCKVVAVTLEDFNYEINMVNVVKFIGF